jgi:4-amino-4-deoxy-L-arabinose transferase-like glycosyltransferase
MVRPGATRPAVNSLASVKTMAVASRSGRGRRAARAVPEPVMPGVSVVIPATRATPALVRAVARALEGVPAEAFVVDRRGDRAPAAELRAAAELESLPLTIVRSHEDALAASRGDYMSVVEGGLDAEAVREMLHHATATDAEVVVAGVPRGGMLGRSATRLAPTAGDPLSRLVLIRRDLADTGAPAPALAALARRPGARTAFIRLPGLPAPLRGRIGVALQIFSLAGARAAVATQAAVRTRAETPRFRWSVLGALALVMLVAGLLRFWALPSLHWYGADEARASMASWRLVKEHRPPLVGQPTSRGTFLGPGYYYLVAPFYLLFGMNPIAGAVVAALAGLGAVWLVWILGRDTFGRGSGLAAAAIMATAPIAVTHSRFGWNPNTLPFWAALFLIALSRAERSRVWLATAALVAAIAPQLHASGLMLTATLGVWLVARRPRLGGRTWAWLGALAAVPLAPIAAGEVRHGFVLTKSWIRLLLGGGAPGGETGGSVVRAFKDLFVTSIGTPRFTIAGLLVLVACGGLIAWNRHHWNDPVRGPVFRAIVMLQIVGCLGVLVWHGEMFAYWLLVWLPGGVVLFAGGIIEAARGIARPLVGSRAARFVPALAVVLIATFNIAAVTNPVRQIDQFEPDSPAAYQNVAAAADWIASRAKGPYRLELWSPYAWDSSHVNTTAYDYLLLRKGLHQTPGAKTVFVVAMEDVATPHLFIVGKQVSDTYERRIADRASFGGLGVYLVRA